jgi:hypothetical protein
MPRQHSLAMPRTSSVRQYYYSSYMRISSHRPVRNSTDSDQGSARGLHRSDTGWTCPGTPEARRAERDEAGAVG